MDLGPRTPGKCLATKFRYQMGRISSDMYVPILKSAPVIYELAELSRKTAAPLKSSGLLSLPSIFCAGQSVRRSG